MAVKTFTQGEVLTAADTNTYLGNAGWVYFSTYTISSAVATFDISGLSTSYDDYMFVMLLNQNAGNIQISVGNTANGHYGTQYYDLYTGVTTGANRSNNAATFKVGVGNTNGGLIRVELYGITTATETKMVSQYFGNGYAGWAAGAHSTATSYTTFRVSADAGGNFTAGTVKIYGLRKA